jgi:hypothetical protein
LLQQDGVRVRHDVSVGQGAPANANEREEGATVTGKTMAATLALLLGALGGVLHP